jgi:predicted ATPase
MRALERLLDRVQAGDAAFALIGGEAGVGKTRLTREPGARAADEGFCVLTRQCVELGAEGLPLAPLGRRGRAARAGRQAGSCRPARGVRF